MIPAPPVNIVEKVAEAGDLVGEGPAESYCIAFTYVLARACGADLEDAPVLWRVGGGHAREEDALLIAEDGKGAGWLDHCGLEGDRC